MRQSHRVKSALTLSLSGVSVLAMKTSGSGSILLSIFSSTEKERHEKELNEVSILNVI